VDDRGDTLAKFHATATITDFRFLAGSRVVAYRPLLSTDHWTLLAAPTDERTLIRFASLSGEDLDLILSKRGHRNQLGFAVQICLMRFPGRVLAPNEIRSALLHFLGDQLGVSPAAFADYARRDETRREQLIEVQAICLCARRHAKTGGLHSWPQSMLRRRPTRAYPSAKPS
jgi:TnpA family transposase